ncbi:MAG TPA: mucoidy inhibitor MuiA family protein [Phycisphaerae bacterium]|nr:mucoidy inhibitor MuiA family protein [Phycisphaerae bacterium]
MRRTGLAVAVLVCCLATTGRADEAIETTGTVDAVTVYRGQAYVTRVVEVAGPVGLREVVITELPEQVVPDSIYAEAADGVEVRSVRYRVRPVEEDVRQEVRELDEKLRQVGDKIEANQRHRELMDEQKTYLDNLEAFVAPTASTELSKGVLNADTLKTLTDFVFEKRQTIAEEELRLQQEGRALHDQEQLLDRQRKLLTGTSARTVREAVVFANVRARDGGRLRLRYLVNQATWSPSYTVRAGADRREVRVDYYASIQQMSGEEWPDVAMALSTATPSLTAKAPTLDPLTVALTPAAERDYKQARKELSQQMQMAARDRINPANVAQLQKRPPSRQQAEPPYFQSEEYDEVLNELARQLQVVDFNLDERITRRGEPMRRGDDESVSVSYQLPSRTTLPSRSDRQLIQIAALDLKGEFYKLAVPVLTDYVYEEATVTNDSELVLLAGPVSTYLADQFVGHGEIPVVTSGERFPVGFGIDPSLRTSRELVERRESVQGGNRVVHFTYRLALENFGGAAAAVRLLDRIPTANKSQVNVTLVSTGPDLSGDAAYLKAEGKKGILRWDVEVPQQATDLEAFAIEYEFDLEYDRQMTVAAVSVTTR